MSVLLHGCASWTLTKHMKKNLDGNCTRMLWAVLNKFWGQYPTVVWPPISKTIQIRWTRLHTDDQEMGNQLEPFYNSSALIQNNAWKTCQERWMLETSVRRKYDTLIHSLGYGRRRHNSLSQPTIVVSRIMEREAVSLFTPLYHYKVIWAWEKPHSLLAMHASAEKQICDHDWYWGRNQQKKPTCGEFSNYRD